MSTLIFRCFFQTRYGCRLPPGPGPSVSARGLVPSLRAYPYHHGTMIDSLQKWVDAYTTLMLVLVRLFPGRAVELIKYLQIISRTEAKFKGLTWLNYEEQYHRPAAHDLSLNWGFVIWSCGQSRSRVRLNLIAFSVTAPSPTQPLSERPYFSILLQCQ